MPIYPIILQGIYPKYKKILSHFYNDIIIQIIVITCCNFFIANLMSPPKVPFSIKKDNSICLSGIVTFKLLL